jgi:hypothetical protein
MSNIFNIGDKVLFDNNSNFTDDNNIWSGIIVDYNRDNNYYTIKFDGVIHPNNNYNSGPQNVDIMYVSNNNNNDYLGFSSTLKHRQADINDDFMTELWQKQIENYKNYMLETNLYEETRFLLKFKIGQYIQWEIYINNPLYKYNALEILSGKIIDINEKIAKVKTNIGIKEINLFDNTIKILH